MRIEFRRNFILLLELEIVSNRYFITDTGIFLLFHHLWKTVWKSGKPLYKRYISWYPNSRKVIMWKNYPH